MDNLDFIRRNLDYLRQSRKDWQLALNTANKAGDAAQSSFCKSQIEGIEELIENTLGFLHTHGSRRNPR
jgi:hypothetical protein